MILLLVLEDRADSGAGEQFIFALVHTSEILVVVIVVPEAMEYAVDDVEEQLMNACVRSVCGLSLRLVDADDEVRVELFGLDVFLACSEIERKDVCCA